LQKKKNLLANKSAKYRSHKRKLFYSQGNITETTTLSMEQLPITASNNNTFRELT